MPPTAALQTLLDRLTPLPAEEQDYLAALLGGYFEAEQRWAAEFERTREQPGRYLARGAAGKIPDFGLPLAEEMFAALPEILQPLSDAVASMLRQTPGLPGSLLRRIHPDYPVYAFPLGAAVRFLGYYREDRMTWFWAGTIADYEELITGMKS
jgi:hypothetical protein